MNGSTNASGGARRPGGEELARFADELRALGPGSGLYPRTIASIDAGRLFHSAGTGASLTLPSGIATGDALFAPNLNPAFFYSWDVHAEQSPDAFRVTVRFTPSDFGIAEMRAYEIAWVVVPFLFDPGAQLVLETSPSAGAGATSASLDAFGVQTLRTVAGPIAPDETLQADLLRSSRTGSWIWLRTDIGFPAPTNAAVG